MPLKKDFKEQSSFESNVLRNTYLNTFEEDGTATFNKRIFFGRVAVIIIIIALIIFNGMRH